MISDQRAAAPAHNAARAVSPFVCFNSRHGEQYSKNPPRRVAWVGFKLVATLMRFLAF